MGAPPADANRRSPLFRDAAANPRLAIVRPDAEGVLVGQGSTRVLGAITMALGRGMRMPKPLLQTLLRCATKIERIEIGLPRGKGDLGYVHAAWPTRTPDPDCYTSLRRVGFVRQTRARSLSCFIGHDLATLVDLDARSR